MGSPTYLIDTHLLYWWMTGSPKLGADTVKRLQDAEIVVSAASLWEMILKNRKGKLPLPDEPLDAAVSKQGFRLVPITSAHLEALRCLNVQHEDPFDRLLLATAIAEQCIFLTRDAPIRAFGLPFVESG
jgi:PIN domain nuclease of toxin-antitoxin system